MNECPSSPSLRTQSYLPSILTVFVSWVSFWMDIESVPGRISLGVVTLLAMSSQAGQGNLSGIACLQCHALLILSVPSLHTGLPPISGVNKNPQKIKHSDLYLSNKKAMALLNERPQLRVLEDKYGLIFKISDVDYLAIHVHIACMVWILFPASEATTACEATLASQQPQRSNLMSVTSISYVTRGYSCVRSLV